MDYQEDPDVYNLLYSNSCLLFIAFAIPSHRSVYMFNIRLKEDRPLVPDFVVGGAPKSGTTSLCHYLNGHPGVFVTNPKEPHFYLSSATGKPACGMNLDRSHYERLFAGRSTTKSPEKDRRGTSTTQAKSHPRFTPTTPTLASCLPFGIPSTGLTPITGFTSNVANSLQVSLSRIMSKNLTTGCSMAGSMCQTSAFSPTGSGAARSTLY